VTYLDYVVFFEKCDQQQPKGFSGNATRLYLKLLAIANGIANGGSWPVEFSKPDPYVAAVAGMSPNTMKECRAALVEGGLLAGSWGEKGQGKMGTYRLLGQEDKVSNSDSLPESKLSESDSLPPIKVSNSDSFTPENDQKEAGKLSNFDTLYKKENKVVVEAASAASPAASSQPAKKPATQKAKGATHAEISALPLPFEGAEFAGTWRSFYTTNTKQAGKAITAFELMLKKLGKYPEAFAVLMIEKAIMGNWQGIENAGTARDFADWQQQQAHQPAPVPPTAAPTEAPQMNAEFLAQQEEQAQARRAARLAQLAAA
jgi:hypothetical protein